MKDAANGLRWCVAEMERRYKLMSALGVRNLAGYNKKVLDAKKAGTPILDPLWRHDPMLLDEEQSASELEALPSIVVIVDELADMMMVVGKKLKSLSLVSRKKHVLQVFISCLRRSGPRSMCLPV